MSPSQLQREIGKTSPFSSPAQEAYLNVVRTAASMAAEYKCLFRSFGLSESGYNVLRIVQGSGDHGRPSQRIAPDMVVQVPDVTRLVDRLENQGLVERCRCDRDRRVVYVKITEQGRDLLRRIEEPLNSLHRTQLEHMTDADLEQLSELLSKARHPDAAETTASG